MSEDVLVAVIIGGVVLAYAVYVMRSAFAQQAEFKLSDQHSKVLHRQRVGLAPSDKQVQQISELLTGPSQVVSAGQVDQWAYDVIGTWVLYAYQPKSEEIEGVLIASMQKSRMTIEHYAVNSGADQSRVADRLTTSLALEAREVGATASPIFTSTTQQHEKQLRPLIVSKLRTGE